MVSHSTRAACYARLTVTCNGPREDSASEMAPSLENLPSFLWGTERESRWHDTSFAEGIFRQICGRLHPEEGSYLPYLSESDCVSAASSVEWLYSNLTRLELVVRVGQQYWRGTVQERLRTLQGKSRVPYESIKVSIMSMRLHPTRNHKTSHCHLLG